MTGEIDDLTPTNELASAADLLSPNDLSPTSDLLPSCDMVLACGVLDGLCCNVGGTLPACTAPVSAGCVCSGTCNLCLDCRKTSGEPRCKACGGYLEPCCGGSMCRGGRSCAGVGSAYAGKCT